MATATKGRGKGRPPVEEDTSIQTQGPSSDFESVLGTFVDAARSTEIQEYEGGIPPGDYSLQLKAKESVAKSNQYGPFVQTTVTFVVVSTGDYEAREFKIVYLINKMKDGQLSYGGQNLVSLAGILAGEPIEDNNPLTADQVVSSAVDSSTVISARVFKRKNGYMGVQALSLES